MVSQSWREIYDNDQVGLIAPFAYAIKQIRGTIAVHFPDLVAYGARNTGKTTVGAQIILSIWNPPEEARIVKGGGDADTKAKHGRLRSLTTFPVVVNEVEGIFNNKELLEDYKNAVENRFVRGKHSHGVYIEIPSLAPFFMTMNGLLPLDGSGAVRKRFFGIHFSLSDEIPKREIEKFTEAVLPRLGDLKFLGSFIFKRISENPERLKEAWQVLATELLREAFEFAELDVPEWVNEFYEGETEEEVNETINEEIRARLLENINNLYARYISRIEIVGENQNDLYTSSTPETRLRALLQEGFLPWAFLRGDEIIITSAVMKILKDLGVDSLKSLAERFGWKYGVHRVNGRNCKSIKVSFSEFVRFLSGDYEDRSNSEGNEPDNPKDNQDNSDDTDVSDFSVESAMGLRKKMLGMSLLNLPLKRRMNRMPKNRIPIRLMTIKTHGNLQPQIRQRTKNILILITRYYIYTTTLGNQFLQIYYTQYIHQSCQEGVWISSSGKAKN